MGEALVELQVLGVWSAFWTELARVVDETRRALAAHLRDDVLELRHLGCRSDRFVGELVTRRALLRFECALAASPPEPGEAALAGVFDERTPLVRILARKTGGRTGAEPRGEVPPCAWLACDPETGICLSSGSDGGPSPLADSKALEPFLFSLLTADA